MVISTTRQGAVFVVAPTGPLISDQVEEAREALQTCFGKGLPRVVLDMQQVQLLDGAALELLLDIRDRCAAQGGSLTLAAPNDLCRDVLRVTDLDRQLAVYDSVLTAVGSYAQ